MKPAWRAADAAAEVRGAARGWRAAGLVDDAVVDAVDARHPTPGPLLGWTWRALVFVCVAAGASSATSLSILSFGGRSVGGVAAGLLGCGLALAIVTDLVVDRCAFRPTGAEAALSLLAVSYLCGGAFALGDHWHVRGAAGLRLLLPWCAAVCGLAAWRWGIRVYAGAAAACLLLLAAQFPGARLAWTGAAGLLVAGAGALLPARGLAPSHRGGLALVRLVGLAALYAAVNYHSVDHGLLEEIGRAAGAPPQRPDRGALLLAGVGSALFPLWLIAWGLRSRDRALIAAGIAAAALSLATIRFYVHVAPLWAVLAVSGAALVGGSLALERWLRAGRDGERGGFTAAPLHDDGRRERLLATAAALALAPEARRLPGEDRGVDGAGRFGGGGSSGAF